MRYEYNSVRKLVRCATCSTPNFSAPALSSRQIRRSCPHSDLPSILGVIAHGLRLFGWGQCHWVWMQQKMPGTEFARTDTANKSRKRLWISNG